MRKSKRFRDAEFLKRDRTISLKLINSHANLSNLSKPLPKKIAQQIMAKIQRDQIAKEVRNHRRKHFFTQADAQVAGYIRNRTLENIITEGGVDLAPILRQRLNPTRKTRILHSGSGHLALDESIKQAFGEKVLITSLNIIHPKPIENPMTMAGKKIQKIDQAVLDRKISPDRAQSLKEHTLSAEKIRKETMQRAKSVDELRISTAERFKTQKRFGIILDIFGPLHYSDFPQEVMQSYIEALEEGGEIITNGEAAVRYKIQREYRDSKTKKRYSIKRERVDERGRIWSIKKVPVQ